ncbi:MAG: type I-E CRISPR-associated protein Cse2/CasB [Chloroflexales bacterium]|nr:type I-E CRISPR-associated protein Cse2/CasB [Chloroflexales bacterium]
MSNETMTPRQRQVQAFIAALTRLDPGGRARLKRNAGRMLTAARDIHRVFFQALPYEVTEWQQEDYFLIATLFPLVPHNPQAGNLGETLRRVRQLRAGPDDSRLNSLDRRFQTLLDSDREQLLFRLRQVVRLIAAHREGVALNWERLLLDVINWEHPDHSVQLRWARAYFVGAYEITASVEEPKGNQP